MCVVSKFGSCALSFAFSPANLLNLVGVLEQEGTEPLDAGSAESRDHLFGPDVSPLALLYQGLRVFSIFFSRCQKVSADRGGR